MTAAAGILVPAISTKAGVAFVPEWYESNKIVQDAATGYPFGETEGWEGRRGETASRAERRPTHRPLRRAHIPPSLSPVQPTLPPPTPFPL